MCDEMQVIMYFDPADVFWDNTAFIYRMPRPHEAGRWSYFLNLHKVRPAQPRPAQPSHAQSRGSAVRTHWGAGIASTLRSPPRLLLHAPLP